MECQYDPEQKKKYEEILEGTQLAWEKVWITKATDLKNRLDESKQDKTAK
jgi:hypothetical protein